MMDWTDRHCRYFLRKLSPNVLLYTEMVTAPALVRGGARHLLVFDPAEHPVAVQLGGADPAELAAAARMAAQVRRCQNCRRTRLAQRIAGVPSLSVSTGARPSEPAAPEATVLS